MSKREQVITPEDQRWDHGVQGPEDPTNTSPAERSAVERRSEKSARNEPHEPNSTETHREDDTNRRVLGNGAIIEWSDENGNHRVVCGPFEQRNWSRVAIATGAAGDRYFVKQHIDGRGTWREPNWQYEHEGTRVARLALAALVDIPPIVHTSPDSLTNVFSFRRVIPADRLLRSDTETFQMAFPDLVRRLSEVIHALECPSSAIDLSTLAEKPRVYNQSTTALGFKGFDIRNAGWAQADSGPLLEDRPVMFDFGRPYRVPIEEMVAKLMISIGLLNWGRPTNRFLHGPDESFLSIGAGILGPYLVRDALLAELALQERIRLREIQGRLGERILKRLGICLMGGRYFAKLRHWVEANSPTRPGP